MNNIYDQIRKIMSEERIAQIINYLPKSFSSKEFELSFLLYYPSEKDKLLLDRNRKSQITLAEWIDRYLIPSLVKKGILKSKKVHMRNKKKTIWQERWTKDLTYSDFFAIVRRTGS